MSTFPFIPNRFVDNSIKAFLVILKAAAASKKEAAGPIEGTQWHGEVDDKVMAWGEGQSATVEWENRAQ